MERHHLLNQVIAFVTIFIISLCHTACKHFLEPTETQVLSECKLVSTGVESMVPHLATTDQNLDSSFSHSFPIFVFHLARTTKWPFCWVVQLTLPILPSVDYRVEKIVISFSLMKWFSGWTAAIQYISDILLLWINAHGTTNVVLLP